MARRFDLGRLLLAAGALLLFVSLFLEWYDSGPNGWQVFEALDLVLLAIAAVALWVAFAPDEAPGWLGWALPLSAVVIVAVQLVDRPPAAGVDADPSSGAWLALAGALLMSAGAVLTLAAISVTVQVAERELRRRRVAAVDRREERAAAAGPVHPDDDRTQPFAAVGEDDEPRSLLAKDPAPPERVDRPERP